MQTQLQFLEPPLRLTKLVSSTQRLTIVPQTQYLKTPVQQVCKLSSTATAADIKKLFSALETNLYKDLLESFVVNKPNVVWLAHYYKDESLCMKAKIEAYEVVQVLEKFDPAVEYNKLQKGAVQIDTLNDWFYNSKLWFRITQNYNKAFHGSNKYNAFVNYIDEYREVFSVNLKKPLMSLQITL